MNKRKIIQHLPLVLLFIVILAAITIRIMPYMIHKYDYVIGFDSGRYMYELEHGISTSPDTLDLWAEPGLNTILFSVTQLTGIEPAIIYKYILPTFVVMSLSLLVYVYTRLVTGSSWGGLYASAILSTSIIFLNSTFDSFYRQIFATILLMSFLYITEKYVKSSSKFTWGPGVALTLFATGVFMTHRGISLLLLLACCVIFFRLVYIRSWAILRYLIYIGIASTLLSSVYWLAIVTQNISILKDTGLSFFSGGSSGGATQIKSLNRSDNQLIGYVKNIFISATALIGLVKLIKNHERTYLSLIIILLAVYILLKATFSNRFIFNMDVLLSICAGAAVVFLWQHLSRLAFVSFVSLSLVISYSNAWVVASNKRPYVPYQTESMTWVKTNISKERVLIIAPDALSTIFTSEGYLTAIYEIPLEFKKKDTRILQTENILSRSEDYERVINQLSGNYDDIYIIFGDWHLARPMGRTKNTITLDTWDGDNNYTKVYDGDSYIYRVYKLKDRIARED